MYLNNRTKQFYLNLISALFAELGSAETGGGIEWGLCKQLCDGLSNEVSTVMNISRSVTNMIRLVVHCF